MELARPSNLVEHLLNSLVVTMPAVSAKLLSDEENKSAAANVSHIAAVQRSSAFISIVLSLLSNLCRGSAAVTEQVTLELRIENMSISTYFLCKKSISYS